MRSIINVTLWLVVLAGAASALTVTVTHGHREIHQGWSPPPPGFHEGSVITHFTGDAPMDTLGAQPGLERVSAATWRYRFGWDALIPQTFVFQDGEGGVAMVETVPSWPPADPGAHGLPVITLDGAPAGLWDPAIGIYVWGDGDEPNWDQRGEEWERDMLFRWWDADGELGHERVVGVRINGNWTRSLAQKSLRLYFDHHGDPEVITDRFFGPDPEDHERLLLRGATTYSYMFVHDPLACDIMTDLGHPVSRWRPVLAYLDGEPWGMYHLRERPDDEWAERQLGLSGDYDLIKDYEGEHPDDMEQWLGFLDAAWEYPDPEDHAFFGWLESQLDLVSYVDWLLLQIWSASADNGGSANRIVYRPEGGRWHLMIYDQDAMFHAWNTYHDYFRFFSSVTEDEFDARKPPAFYQIWIACHKEFRFFAAFMQNASARRVLRERWDLLSSTVLSQDGVDQRLDAIVATNEPGEAFHHDRWHHSPSFASAAASVSAYVADRLPQVASQYADFMDECMEPVELDALTADGAGDQVTLAWHTQREIGMLGWILERRPDAFTPWEQVAHYTTHPELASQGGSDLEAYYTFSDPVVEGAVLEYRLSWVNRAQQVIVVPWIEPVDWPDEPPATVLVNEFLASNDTNVQDETGAHEDWLEIYNPGDAPVDLTGYHLSDDPDEPLKWPLPDGTIVAAGGFLLIWCDDDEEDGPLHASFKLSADGESIGIYALQDEAVVVVDEHAFGPQTTDVSEGRAPDGGDQWVSFATPTPGASNGVVAVGDVVPAVASVSARPNPFNPTCTVAYTVDAAGPVHVDVYDVAGRCVRRLVTDVLLAGEYHTTWNGGDDRGASLPSGTYQVLVRTAGGRATCKVSLVR